MIVKVLKLSFKTGGCSVPVVISTIYNERVITLISVTYLWLVLSLIAISTDTRKLNSTVSGNVNKKFAASKAYSIPPANGVFKMLKICLTSFFRIKLLHARLKYVCIKIPAKY